MEETPIISKIIKATPTYWKAEILVDLIDDEAEYVLSSLLNQMWIVEWEQVDIIKRTTKTGRLFMIVKKCKKGLTKNK